MSCIGSSCSQKLPCLVLMIHPECRRGISPTSLQLVSWLLSWILNYLTVNETLNLLCDSTFRTPDQTGEALLWWGAGSRGGHARHVKGSHSFSKNHIVWGNNYLLYMFIPLVLFSDLPCLLEMWLYMNACFVFCLFWSTRTQSKI